MSPAGYCSRCGASFEVEYRFCARCGAVLGGTAMAANRERHFQVLAVLLLAWGIVSFGLYLLAVVAAGTVAAFLAKLLGISLPQGALPALVAGVGALLTLVSVLAIVAGVGLLQYQPWGWGLALVVCALALIRPPFGTVIGVYGLWVLLAQEGERYYRARAIRRA